MPFLDRLGRLRLFRRAARLERDLRSTIDVGMPALLTEARQALDPRLALVETFYRPLVLCTRCDGVFHLRGMRLFWERVAINGNGKAATDTRPIRVVPACRWCADEVKRRGQVGKELTTEERVALLASPAPPERSADQPAAQEVAQ